MASSTGTDCRVVVSHSQIKSKKLDRGNRDCNLREALRLPVTPLIFILIISAGSYGLPRVQGKDGELCVVETPLKTSYFIPYIQTHNPCSGCLFPNTKKNTQENKPKYFSDTHVLQIENTIGGITELTLNYLSNDNQASSATSSANISSPQGTTVVPPPTSSNVHNKQIVVVTSSQSTPVSLYVVVEPQARNISISLVTRPQDIVSFHTPAEPSITIQDWEDSSSNLDELKKEFGYISSFSIAKNANKITLNLRKELPNVEGECSIYVSKESPIAECSITAKKETSGCFHEKMIGVDKRDIHIIEIDDEFEKSNNNSIAIVINGVTTRGLSPQNDNEIIKRNVTLVLRSGHPTFWTLRVSNLQGIITLLVGDGDQVENKSSSGQNIVVNVKRQELPKSFDQMFLSVLTKIGPPVSYTRTESPSIINIIVPPKQQLTVSEKSKSVFASPSASPAKRPENAERLIDRWVNVACQKSEVSISLPLWVANKVGGVFMSLRDQACQGVQNGTHVVLRSKFSECEFFQEEKEGAYLYTNFAHIDHGQRFMGITDDEDFEGSGYGNEDLSYGNKIPTIIVKCKTAFRAQDKKGSEKYLNLLKYSLTIYKDEDLQRPYYPKDLPILVPPNSVLYAEVKFSKEFQRSEIVSNLKIHIDSCILSSSEHFLSNPVTIIRKSCSFQPYVTITKSYLNANLAFHFQLSLEFLPSEKVFLHCQIGVCSSDSLPKASVNKCMDPEDYCNKDTLIGAFSNQAIASYVDIVTVGPFIVQPSQDALSGTRNFLPNTAVLNHNKELETKTEEDGTKYGGNARKTQIIVMEGLSTEIVVGIAIASFIIGVCLTATLWIIYLKTDPRRQKRPELTMPRNSAYDLSAHSGSSTPSSQAPISA